jgi:hypothetical protein
MIEGMMIGFAIFLCVIIGAAIARLLMGRMDLFKVDDNNSDSKKPQ